jgi:erythromycin esterase-like protein
MLLLAAACAAISGSGPLLAAGNTVLIGEMHGSQQIPRAVAALSCAAARRKLAVTVALEQPVEDAGALEAFARGAAPLKTEFWTRPYQDGRSSKAMLRLLEDLRALRRSGARIRVAPFDPHPADSKLRDGQMAERLAALRKERPADLFLVLSGNLHNRLTVGVPWDAEYRPMGWHLAQAGVRVVSLDAAYKTGTTWMCETPDAKSCGPHPVRGKDRGEKPSVQLDGSGPYNGSLYVGALRASPPAMR